MGIWFTHTSTTMVFTRHAQTCYLYVGSLLLEDIPCGSERTPAGCDHVRSSTAREWSTFGTPCWTALWQPLPWTVSRTDWTGSGHRPPSDMTINPYWWLYTHAHYEWLWPTQSRAVSRHWSLKNRRGHVYVNVSKIIYEICFKYKRRICLNKKWQRGVPLLASNPGDMARNVWAGKNFGSIHECEAAGVLAINRVTICKASIYNGLSGLQICVRRHQSYC